MKKVTYYEQVWVAYDAILVGEGDEALLFVDYESDEVTEVTNAFAQDEDTNPVDYFDTANMDDLPFEVAGYSFRKETK